MKLEIGSKVKFRHEGKELAGRVATSGAKRSKVIVDIVKNDGDFAIYSVVNVHTDPATELETATMTHDGPIPEGTTAIKVEGCSRC